MVRFLISFIFTISISSAGRVSGIVYLDGRLVKNTQVRLLEKHRGNYEKFTWTTSRGYYEFSNVPKGDYELIVSNRYSVVPITIKGFFDKQTIDIRALSYSEKKKREKARQKELSKQKINRALNHPFTKNILIFITIIFSGWLVKKKINKIAEEKERKEEYLRRAAIAKETRRKNKIKEEKKRKEREKKLQEEKERRKKARKLKLEKERKEKNERLKKRVEYRKKLKEKAKTPYEKKWAIQKFYDLDTDRYRLEGIIKIVKSSTGRLKINKDDPYDVLYLNNKKIIRFKTLGLNEEILERAIFKGAWLGRGIVNNIKEKKKEVKWVDLEIDAVKRKILKSRIKKAFHTPPFKLLNPKPKKSKPSKRIKKPQIVQTFTDNIETALVGTGFLISKEGYIATAYHVIEDASIILVRFPLLNLEYKAKVISRDENNDVALLKIPKTQLNSHLSTDIPFFISNQNKFDLGQDVYAYGYPLGEHLGSKPSFSDGRISSFEGIRGNKTTYRVSNPIQPGNSGGPIVDNKGRLLGIIVSSLDAFASLEISDALPQNVNFAVKTDYLIALTNSTFNSSSSSSIFNNDTTPTELSPTELTKKILPFVPQIRTNIPEVTDEMRFEREEPKGLLGNLADGLNKWLEEIE